MPTDSRVSAAGGSREREQSAREFATRNPEATLALTSTALETLHESAWLPGKVALKTLC